MKNLAQVKIFGMKLPIFAIFFIITLGGIAIGVLPKGMIGNLLVLMILGELLGFIGDRLPILRTYLGGGVFLCLFGASAIVYF